MKEKPRVSWPYVTLRSDPPRCSPHYFGMCFRFRLHCSCSADQEKKHTITANTINMSSLPPSTTAADEDVYRAALRTTGASTPGRAKDVIAFLTFDGTTSPRCALAVVLVCWTHLTRLPLRSRMSRCCRCASSRIPIHELIQQQRQSHVPRLQLATAIM